MNNIYQETFTNSAEFGIINQRDFFDKDISNKANLAGYYVVQNNDFVYNPRISNFAPVGPIKRNKLGRNGVMSPLYYVFRVDSVDYQFLETYFENTQWHIFMKENGDNGARSDRFAIKDSVFSTMPILLPSQQEQTAIGNFFRQLDEAIASHQRKLERTNKLKKSLLQKMFPKDGEAFPELRFPDFTDAWEQRKLGEVGQIYTGNTPPTSDKDNWSTQDNEYIWITPTDINSLTTNKSERYLSKKGWDKARVVPKHSILITSIASIGKNTINSIPAAFNQQINAIVPKNNDAYFILSAMIKNVEKFASLAGRTATPIINKTTFQQFALIIPLEPEQTAIGNFFRQLDEAIASHQRKP